MPLQRNCKQGWWTIRNRDQEFPGLGFSMNKTSMKSATLFWKLRQAECRQRWAQVNCSLRHMPTPLAGIKLSNIHLSFMTHWKMLFRAWMFTPAATWRPVKSEWGMRRTEGGRKGVVVGKEGETACVPTGFCPAWKRSRRFHAGCKATEGRLAAGGTEEGDTGPDHNRRLSVCVGCGHVFFLTFPS